MGTEAGETRDRYRNVAEGGAGGEGEAESVTVSRLLRGR